METEIRTNVIKRNGEEVIFDKSKIINAIKKANEEVPKIHQLSEFQIMAVAETVASRALAASHAVNVEDIQDMVETGIMEMRGYEVAQKYVRYRYKRELTRKSNTTDDNILSLLDQINENAKQENSNKNPTINSTQRDYMAGEVSKDLTMRVLLPEDIVRAHEEGIIHFHDSDYYAQSMGVNIKVFKIALILLSSILSGCVTAFAGPISFVGIAVPHLVKLALKTARPLVVIPGVFLGGAVFCMMCDLIARMAFSPLELNISTVTSIFGAPVVIVMMLRKKGRQA